MKHLYKLIIVLNIVLWSYNIYNFDAIWMNVTSYFYDIKNSSNFARSDMIDLGIRFDFCGEVTESSDRVAQLQAGTPVPFEPVVISTQVVAMTPAFVQSEPTTVPGSSEQVAITTPTPSPSPIPAVPTQAPMFSEEPLEVVRAVNYSDENYHIVFVPVGYGDNGV